MEKSEIGSKNNFAIGPIVVQPARNIVSHGSDIYALEPKIMDVLEHLVVHQGQVCSREDIIAAVWKVEYGADESLTRAISVIRKTFRQAGGKGRYIQTISKRGYSLQEAVSKISVSNTARTAVVERALVAPSLAEAPLAEPSLAQAPFVEPHLAREKAVAATTFADHTDSTTFGVARPPKRKTKTLGISFALVAVLVTAALTWQGQGQLPQSSESFRSELAISPYGRSVAVMPFVDLSAEKNHQYFSDGISEELSIELGKINTLRIIGQRLGGADNHGNMSYEEVGNKLKVSHIIDGSVRKQAEKVRITAQLINTADNSRAWSSNYDGTLDDVFELQQRVASDIATQLSLVLSLNISEPIDLETALPVNSTLNSE